MSYKLYLPGIDDKLKLVGQKSLDQILLGLAARRASDYAATNGFKAAFCHKFVGRLMAEDFWERGKPSFPA